MLQYLTDLMADPKSFAPVIAACVAAIASAIGAWLSFRFSRAKSRDEARTAYEYEARKRLYAECQPILFQMVDAASSLWGRLSQMAIRASEGRLDPGPTSWMNQSYGPYYRQNTIYRIFRLLALGRLLKSKLTLFDASLDDNIRDKFILGSIAEDIFNSDFALAQTEPQLPYDPYGKKKPGDQSPAKFEYQGLVRGETESLTDSLIVDEKSNRIMRWHEFEEAIAKKASPLRKYSEPVGELFLLFHPVAKPVLWRILVCYALLSRMLIFSLGRPADLDMLLNEREDLVRLFDYRPQDQRSNSAEVAAHIDAAIHFLRSRIAEERVVYDPHSTLPGDRSAKHRG